MPGEPAGAAQDGLIVGTIRGPHGVRGEVRVYTETDVPERFRAGSVLQCDGVGPLTIVGVRGPADEPIVHFRDYDSRPAADALKGRLLRVSREESRRATQGSYLWADLVGLDVVTEQGESLGRVAELLRAGGADVLVVRDAGARERLLPMIGAVVREIDVPGGRIVVVPQEEA